MMTLRTLRSAMHSAQVRALPLALVAGLLCGASAALFLSLLDGVTELREATPLLPWLLPAGGALLGLAYARWGREAGQGVNRIIDAVVEGGHSLPRRMAPMVLAGTLVTHLVGGSAGREGTAVQMGAGLAEWVGRLARVSPQVRRLLLFAGVGGGFGAVFGTPIAGALFAAEFSVVRRLRSEALAVALAAALVGDATARALGVRHAHLPAFKGLILAPAALAAALVLGLCAGLAARGFVALTAQVRSRSETLLPSRPARLAAGGTVLLLLSRLPGGGDYLGLGLPLLQQALHDVPMHAGAFAGKLLFTAVTVGVGFIGGEVTPLFVAGTLLGQAVAVPLAMPVPLAACLGMVVLFGAAARTPIALVVMGCELFGVGILGPLLLAMLAATLVGGRRGIYERQRPLDASPFVRG